MYVFPASQFKVHAANEPGLAGEQSALSGILISHRQGVAVVLSNSGVVENAHVMSKGRGAKVFCDCIGTSYLSTETISRLPQSHETIPLTEKCKKLIEYFAKSANWSQGSFVNSFRCTKYIILFLITGPDCTAIYTITDGIS
jgi:hypothetical protein